MRHKWFKIEQSAHEVCTRCGLVKNRRRHRNFHWTEYKKTDGKWFTSDKTPLCEQSQAHIAELSVKAEYLYVNFNNQTIGPGTFTLQHDLSRARHPYRPMVEEVLRAIGSRQAGSDAGLAAAIPQGEAAARQLKPTILWGFNAARQQRLRRRRGRRADPFP
jgi:hypothetical protein